MCIVSLKIPKKAKVIWLYKVHEILIIERGIEYYLNSSLPILREYLSLVLHTHSLLAKKHKGSTSCFEFCDAILISFSRGLLSGLLSGMCYFWSVWLGFYRAWHNVSMNAGWCFIAQCSRILQNTMEASLVGWKKWAQMALYMGQYGLFLVQTHRWCHFSLIDLVFAWHGNNCSGCI